MQVVPLVPGDVDGEGEPGPVRGDVAGPERRRTRAPSASTFSSRTTCSPAGGPSVPRTGRSGKVGEVDPPGDAVLEPLDGAPVVPPAAVAHGHAEVGLLGAAADLLDDLVGERFARARSGGGVGVLRLQVGREPRVVAVGHPRVVVDDGVPVDRAGRRVPRRPGCWRRAHEDDSRRCPPSPGFAPSGHRRTGSKDRRDRIQIRDLGGTAEMPAVGGRRPLDLAAPGRAQRPERGHRDDGPLRALVLRFQVPTTRPPTTTVPRNIPFLPGTTRSSSSGVRIADRSL